MGMEKPGRIDQEKYKERQEDAVGEGCSYIGKRIAVKQAAGQQQDDRPAVWVEPTEESGKKHSNNRQEIESILKEDW
ncbi:hypothetical protein GCM10011511_32170 [Puia dinghuensis]|uniref:Uncharacterized protein n=1 Tax=Puia dinghuensis TaxID=1792502 RepID=A0A8J2XUA6_9BACT|nr:hypothetical protein GCM10011511_32170 [Puia dinghuensis]